MAARWLFATETGEMVRSEVDARVGGRFTFTDRRNGEDVEHTGEYLEIERPRRLVFTFGVPKYAKHFDRVKVEIAAREDGCELTLSHEMNPEWSEYAKGTQDGWTMIVEGLAAAIGEKRAGVNRVSGEFVSPTEVRFTRLLPGPIERVWEFLTDSEKRGRWFGGGPMELRAGGQIQFHFRHANLSPDEQPPKEHLDKHDPGIFMQATVLRCEAPHLLSFTMPLGNDRSLPESEVTMRLTPEGDDVRLELVHQRLNPNNSGVGSGWHTHLALLVALLSESTLPPFWAMHQRLNGVYAEKLRALEGGGEGQ